MITADNRSKETQDFFNEMLEEHGGFSPASRCDMDNFIEEHGEDNFRLYFEDYIRMIDEYDEETVDAFLECFDLMDVEHLNDAYYGRYDSGAEFAQNMVSDCGYVHSDLLYWIEIDWEKTWDNLSYDYSESNGYIFSNNW